MALPPPTGVAMRAFYPVLGEMELSAEFKHTTKNFPFEIKGL
jgi:hypothetical protein